MKRSELFHTSRFILPTFASAQWESNPHFRHGKAAGYRYIMGAKCITTKLSKIKDAEASRAPSRNRTRITSLRRRSLAVRPSVLVFQWDR